MTNLTMILSIWEDVLRIYKYYTNLEKGVEYSLLVPRNVRWYSL